MSPKSTPKSVNAAKAAAERAALERWEGEGGRTIGRPKPKKPRPGFRSILVPIDLTSGSDRVLGRLSLLPLAADARITILHVVPRGLAVRQQRGAERDASKALENEVRHLRRSLARSVTVKSMVRAGVVPTEIVGCAAKVRSELIVMGRRGRKALRDAFLGSTAERVIRQSQRPVLVVRLSPRAVYRRPALAVELDQSLHEVLRLMLLVLPPPRPRISVIHAYDFPYGGPTYPSLSHAEGAEIKEELALNATRKLGSLLKSALSKTNALPEELPAWKTYVRYGQPRAIVTRIMQQTDTDLLLLGTRGHAGVALLFLGSVAGDLLREATCDVLVVPPARSRRNAAARAGSRIR